MTLKPDRIRPAHLVIFGVILMLCAILFGVAAWGVLLSARNTPVEIEQGTTPSITSLQSATGIPNTTAPTMTSMPSAGTPSVALTPSPPPGVDLVKILAEMTLEEKIGQVIMTGIPGPTLDAYTAGLIAQYDFGSVVYFGENTVEPGQTLALSQALQNAAMADGGGIPLLIAIDHEGGEVFRFQQGMTHFPALMTLGAAGSEDLAYEVGAANATELRAVGINLDLGPVLDINDEPLNPVIGIRAAAGFPNLVTDISLNYIRGLQENGVAAAVKHFPGHGSTTVDSHEVLPIIEKSAAELAENELIPFRQAVQNGVGVVMVGHLAFPEVDPTGKPATLSPVFIQDILRQDLGFQGVVMTDAMNMSALTADFSAADAALQAFSAGCDILAYTELEDAVTAHNILLNAAQSGALQQAKLDEAVRRILELKARFKQFSPTQPADAFSWPEHEDLALRLASEGVVQVGAAPPPLVTSGMLLLITPDVLSSGSVQGDGLSLLGERLESQGIDVDEWIYPVDNAGGAAAILNQALGAFQQHPQAVLVTWDAHLEQNNPSSPVQVEMIRSFQAVGKPLVLVAASSPYDLSLLASDGSGLATFGGLDIQIDALARALTASKRPAGEMPVSLNP